MADYKVDVEVLAVGQGSCNVVSVTELPSKLVYVAILDAGGDKSSSSPPVADSKDKLVNYIKERAAVASAGSTLYADLLMLSHSDQDHYSIIGAIAKEANKPMIITVPGGSKKVADIPSKKTSFKEDGDERLDYACVKYADNNVSLMGGNYHQYAYLFQAEFENGYDVYMLKVFNNNRIGAGYQEKIICGKTSDGVLSMDCTQSEPNKYLLKVSPERYFYHNSVAHKWDKMIVEKSITGYTVTLYFTVNTAYNIYIPGIEYFAKIDVTSSRILYPDTLFYLGTLCGTTTVLPDWIQFLTI
jgi:hypothetical protein